MIPNRYCAALLVAAALPLLPAPPGAAAQDSATVVAGARYEAGSLQRTLLGARYRELWTTPVRVELLDMEGIAGGLTAVERGGNVQTLGLRMHGANGQEFNFRSIDKELTQALPPFAQETLLDWIRQDVTSAQMPVAPIVATPLLEAVGILNPGPRLVVLPDHPRLGEFREEFAGMFGTFEQHASEIEEGVGGFAGSVEVKSTEGMLDDVEDSPRDRIDTRSYLTARLVDLLIGDWDRHEGQWRWARYDRGETRWWIPVPEDRDYAFVAYDGLLLQAARTSGLARLVSFGDKYAPTKAMLANSLELNRRLLAELPRPVWDSIAGFVQSRISDQVLADAVARVPPELQGTAIQQLEQRLRIRRDALPAAAREFYLYMAEMVEIHSTDASEEARVTRHPDGSVAVSIVTAEGVPVFERTLLPAETREIRIDLHGGNDHAVVEGESGDITVRVLGGGDDDRLEDRGRGPTILYDSEGRNELSGGADTRMDRRPYEPPADPEGLLPDSRSDWGRSVSISPLADWRSHVGVVVGGTISRTSHGFRYDPRKSQYRLSALVAPLSRRAALEWRAEMRRENSDRWFELLGEATTLRAVRFHGFGNATTDAEDDSRVWLRGGMLSPRFHFPLSRYVELVTGAAVRYTDPSFRTNAPVAAFRPLGTEATGQLQGVVELLVDSRDDRWFPRRGVEAELEATAAPPVWDLDEAYSRIDGTVSTFFPLPVGAALALRGGGTKLWGAYPFFEAAFLGGSHTIRGFQRERYSGDGMVFGNVELRVPLVELELIARGKLGVSGLYDAGRVYVDGDSPGGWHHAKGGSVWFATPALSVSATYARGVENRFYADIGLPF